MALTRLSKEERDKLSAADFADPDHRLYPVFTQEDVEATEKLLARLPHGTRLRGNLLEIAKRRGLKVPGEETSFSVEFSLTPEAISQKRVDGDHVVIPCPIIFRCGDYPDKNFSLSPEEADACVIHDFSPVELDLEHKPTVLSGKLGKLSKIEMNSQDPYLLGGEVRIPCWLDSVLGADERKLSAAFCRNTKKLIGCGIVRNPRVNDAAMMAAFYKDEAAHAQPTPVAVTPVPASTFQATGNPDVDRLRAEFGQREAELQAQLEAERKRLADMAAANEAAARERRREVEGRIAAEAINFADAEVLGLRALPSNRDQLIALYQQAARDDFANPEPVQFGSERITRVEALKRTQRTREPYQGLTQEMLAQQPGIQALFNQPSQPSPSAPMSEERRKELLSMTQVGRTVLARQSA
jgi:hypothetical protein